MQFKKVLICLHFLSSHSKGADILAEVFVFVVAASYVVYEYIGSAKKTQKQKEELAAKLASLEASELRLSKDLATLQVDVRSLLEEIRVVKESSSSRASPSTQAITAAPLATAPSQTWVGYIGSFFTGN